MSHWLLQQLAKFKSNCSGEQQLGALLVVWPRGTAAITCHHSSNELETRAKTPWPYFAIFRRGGMNPQLLCVAGPVGAEVWVPMTECRDQFARAQVGRLC